VCVGTLDSTTASNDPSSSALCVVCVGNFPRGVPGGEGMPPLVTNKVSTTGDSSGFGAAPQNFFFWVVFAIFSEFCYF
jgi:hypothetical protein